MYKPAAV